VSIVLHPIAMVLAWINIAGAPISHRATKIIWGVVSIIWGIGPIVYMLAGGGEIW